MEQLEAAKKLNPLRRNVLLEVDFVNGEPASRIAPLESRLSNPMPIEGQAQNSLIDQAVKNKWQIEFTTKDGKLSTLRIINKDGGANIVKVLGLSPKPLQQSRKTVDRKS